MAVPLPSKRGNGGAWRDLFGHGWPNESAQGRLERSRKAPPLHRVSDTEHRTPEEPTFLNAAGIKKAAWGEAAWGSFKCLKEGGMRVA